MACKQPLAHRHCFPCICPAIPSKHISDRRGPLPEVVRARRLLGRSPPLPRWGASPKLRSPYYLQVKSTAPPQTYSALIKILKKEQWLPGCCSMCWPPGPRQNFMGEGVGHEVFVYYVLWMQGLFLEFKSSQERAASIRCPAVQQKVRGPKKKNHF